MKGKKRVYVTPPSGFISLTRKKMRYFKNGRPRNSSACLAIYVGVLALI